MAQIIATPPPITFGLSTLQTGDLKPSLYMEIKKLSRILGMSLTDIQLYHLRSLAHQAGCTCHIKLLAPIPEANAFANNSQVGIDIRMLEEVPGLTSEELLELIRAWLRCIGSFGKHNPYNRPGGQMLLFRPTRCGSLVGTPVNVRINDEAHSNWVIRADLVRIEVSDMYDQAPYGWHLRVPCTKDDVTQTFTLHELYELNPGLSEIQIILEDLDEPNFRFERERYLETFDRILTEYVEFWPKSLAGVEFPKIVRMSEYSRKPLC